jgi:hypothetical protein
MKTLMSFAAAIATVTTLMLSSSNPVAAGSPAGSYSNCSRPTWGPVGPKKKYYGTSNICTTRTIGPKEKARKR